MTPLFKSDAKGGAEHLTLAYVAPAGAPNPPARPMPDFLSGQAVRMVLSALGGAGLAVLIMQMFSATPPRAAAVPASMSAAVATTPGQIAPASASPETSAPAKASALPNTSQRKIEAPKTGNQQLAGAESPDALLRKAPPALGRSMYQPTTSASSGHLDGKSEMPAPENTIAIRHGNSTPRVHPALLPAWTAFQAGDLDASLAGYRKAAAEEPHNTDALHGMAAIALRQDRPSEAIATYRRILELTPQDSQAQTALASLSSARNPESEESHLQSILIKEPQSATAHFALGNLYARNGRWQEAETAYFNALGLAPDNPDYRFNLAVSLDQLGQGKEAARHYRGALAQAASHPAGFDPVQVAARLAELDPRE